MLAYLVAGISFIALALILYVMREVSAAAFSLAPAAETGMVGEVAAIVRGVLEWVAIPLLAGLAALAGTLRVFRKAPVPEVLSAYVWLVSAGALAYAGVSLLVMNKAIYPDIMEIAVQALFAGLAAAVWAAITGAALPDDVGMSNDTTQSDD